MSSFDSSTTLLKQIRQKSLNSSTVIQNPPVAQPVLFSSEVPNTQPTLTSVSASFINTTTPAIETTSTNINAYLINTVPAISMSLDQLLLDLKIIANIKEYDKLAINDITKQLTIDKPYMLQGVLRYLYGQGREQALEYIETIINAVFTITDELLETSTSASIKFADDTKSIYQNIVHHLTSSITGLQNMKITYMKDIPCTSRIQLIIEKIQNRIQKINNLMKIS
jgi:hypothetical protein